MMDTWYLNVYLTWHILLCVLSTLLFIYFIHAFSYFSVYVFFICSHVICTCYFQCILIHSLGVLTPWIYISRFVAIYCWSGIWRGSQTSWGTWIFSIWLSVLLLNFYLWWFLILYIYHFQLSFYSLFHLLSCMDIYMYCCSDIILS